MAFKLCLIQFLNGFKDSLFGCIKFFQKQKLLSLAIKQKQQQNDLNKTSKPAKSKKEDSNEKLYKQLIQSCILNGVFLLSCILMFNFVLMPILNWIAFKLITDKNQNLITDYLNPIMQMLFSFVWILPVFLLSKIFNLICHQEIADIAYVQKYGKPKIKLFKGYELLLGKELADVIFSCTMELIFLVQTSLMNLIPLGWLTQVLCHVHLSFLYSLYSFEYKFYNMGWDIKKRMNFIESRWPYFFGFGLSLSVILSFAGPYIYSATLFASIFPAFILSAIETEAELLSPIVYLKKDANSPNGYATKQVTFKLPLFRFSLYLTDFIFYVFLHNKKLNKNKQAEQANSQATNPANRAAQLAAFTIRKTN